MIALPAAVDVPLRTDDGGNIRVSGTRVTLDTIIGFYRQRETPESLHEAFPTVPLADIYAVIAYYLAHRADVDEYLKQRDDEAERIRREVESSYTPEQKARTGHFRTILEQKRPPTSRI